MKKFLFTIILMLSLLSFSAPTAFSAYSYSVDKVEIEIDLQKNGNALVTEEWTVTVAQGSTSDFVREIDKTDDNFERVSAINDISVSVDGSICTHDTSENAQFGSYAFSDAEGSFKITFAAVSEGTHVFSLRYMQPAAVKNYKNKSYFYFRAVSESSDVVCRDVTIRIAPESECLSEDFEILEAGLLAGEKTDGEIKFSASNTAGLVKIGIAMNERLFDTHDLTLIEDNNTAWIVTLAVGAVISLAVCVYLIYFSLKYETLLREKREKLCKKKPLDEPFAKTQRAVFRKISPALLINTVIGDSKNPADAFVVTALDLFCRGYITLTQSGFNSSYESMTDAVARLLSKNEKRVIRIFSAENLSELVASPKKFYEEIEAFNKNSGHLSPFTDLSESGRKLIRRCFEIKLSAKRFEFISPCEISDSIFRNTKYTVGDLVISIINEKLRDESEIDNHSSKEFKRNLFTMRDIYDEGKRLVLDAEDAKTRKRAIK